MHKVECAASRKHLRLPWTERDPKAAYSRSLLIRSRRRSRGRGEKTSIMMSGGRRVAPRRGSRGSALRCTLMSGFRPRRLESAYFVSDASTVLPRGIAQLSST
jgi:hypothetical protein